uniref:SIS domain-containing protein n=1 Tax=Enterobacter cloacae TaxID=550 RepID=UPI001F0884C7
VVVMGMGKSGHIGRKMAATFASTGTSAFFVHPGEAAHGDLGMVTPQDVVIVLSLGGYTREIIESAAIASQYGAKVIAITPAGTPLAEQADLV